MALQLQLNRGRPLLPHQQRFIASRAWVRVILGAIGSGKTTAAAIAIAINALQNPWSPEWGTDNPTTVIAGLSWRTLRDSSEKTLREVMPAQLIRRVWKAEHRWLLANGHVFLFRSLAKGAELEGLNASAGWLDEAQAFASAESWLKVQARVRHPLTRRKLLVCSGIPQAGWLQDTFDREEHRDDPERLLMMCSTEQNTILTPDYVAQLRSSVGADDAPTLLGGQWRHPQDALYPSYDPRIHVTSDAGDKTQPVHIALDVGNQSAILVLQERPQVLRVVDGPRLVQAERGLRLHVVDELMPENVSTEQAMRLFKQRGWRLGPQSKVFVDPRTHIDQLESIRRVLGPEVAIIKKQRGSPGFLVEEGIRAVSAALRDADDRVRLTFSTQLPRGKRSLLTGIPKLRRRGQTYVKDNTTDHSAGDALRYPVVHLLPLRSGHLILVHASQ